MTNQIKLSGSGGGKEEGKRKAKKAEVPKGVNEMIGRRRLH